MPTAVIYCRLSRNRNDGRSASTRRQEDDCRKLCADRGWTVAAVEVDDDRSAYSGKPRPGYAAALAHIEDRTADAIVAWHPDRLHRRPVELEAFIDVLERTGAEVATVQTGDIDLASPAGRLQARMLGTLARYESEHRSERTKSAHEAIAAQGRWSGGKRVYGYRCAPDHPGGLEVVPDEAERIRQWCTAVLGGQSLGALATEANEHGVPTTQGGAWTVPSIRGIITSDRIAGRRTHRRTGTSTAAQWEPIITPEELDAVRSTLRARGGRRNPEGWRDYLLSGGIARCGLCGAALVAQRSSGGSPRYVCPARSRGGCGGISVNADRLEDQIALMVCAAASEVTPEMPQHDDAGTAELEGRLAELAKDYAQGSLTRVEWDAARGVIVAKLDAVQATRRSDPLDQWRHPGALTEAWPGLSVPARRVVTSALVEQVEVRPATKRGPVWDPKRVSVRWKA